MQKKLGIYYDAIKVAMLKSPIEIIVSGMFYLLSIYIIFFDSNRNTIRDLGEILAHFLICFNVSYFANILFTRKRIFYYSTLFLPVIITLLILIFECKTNEVATLIATICSVLLVFVSKKLIDNREFAANAIKVTSSYITSSILSLIAALIALSIYMSIIYIFNIDEVNDIIAVIFSTSGFILAPILFLSLEYKAKKDKIELGRPMSILLNYILSPSIIIYGVILYIYFAKVTFLWTLPKGVISTTAITFLAIGIFVYICRAVLERKVLNWVFKYFTYISLPALIMLWVGTIYRVTEYGLTGNRVYLIVTIITLTLWVSMMLFKRHNKHQYLTLFTIIIYLIFTYTPGISYEDFNRRAVDIEIKSEPESRHRRLYMTVNNDTIDIEGYKELTWIDKYFNVANDTLTIYDSKDNVILKDNVANILDNICKDIDSTDYKSMDIQELKEHLEHSSRVYKMDNNIIILNTIDLEQQEGGDVKISGMSIECVITRKDD